MKIFGINDFGDTSKLQLITIDKPIADHNQVIIKTQAIGLNPIDIKTRSGGGIRALLTDEVISQKPIILGWDIAGVVESVGSQVDSLKVGDKVMAMAGFPQLGKTYAEYVAIDAEQLVLIPNNIDFVTAATLPLAALTAYQALFEIGDLKAGQRVLIHAVAGGVGHLAVQMAKEKGAYVIGTASAKKHAQIKKLGIDEVIDYQQQDFTKVIDAVDLAFDTVGGETTVRSLKVIKPHGKLVSILPGSLTEEAKYAAAQQQIEASELLVHQSQKQLQAIAKLVKENKLVVHLDKQFPFEKMIEAHNYLESGQVNGKVAIVFNDD